MKQEWRTWNITGRACLGDKVSTIKSNVNKFIEITMSEKKTEYKGMPKLLEGVINTLIKCCNDSNISDETNEIIKKANPKAKVIRLITSSEPLSFLFVNNNFVCFS